MAGQFGFGTGEVPVGPLQEAVAAYLRRNPDETLSSIALRCGWEVNHRGNFYGDGCRLARRLGLKEHSGRRGRHTTYATALSIAHGIDADPVELGL